MSKYILAFLLLSLPFSCQQSTELPLPQVLIDPAISVEEAQSWFEQNYGGAATARTAQKNKKSPLWGLAKQSKFKKGYPLVVVPLDYEGDEANLTAVFDGTDHPATPEVWERRHTLIRKLIVYKNKKNESKGIVMYVIPSTQYKRENPRDVKGENFSGLLLFKDFEEEILLEAWHMENGLVKEVRSGLGESKKNGRLTSECFLLAYGYFECSDNSGGGQLGGGHWNDPNSHPQTTGNCNFVQTGNQLICDGGSVGGGGGGYFGGELPPGSGGGGFDPIVTSSVYEASYVNQFMSNYGHLFQGRNAELDYVLNNPALIDGFLYIIGRYGTGILNNLEQLIYRIGIDFGFEINQSERNALANAGYYRPNLLSYAANAAYASIKTEFAFPSITNPTQWNNPPYATSPSRCGDCYSNAYKHALFVACNSHVFSSYYAQELANAHELNLAGPSVNMDNWNNTKGIETYNEFYFSQYSRWVPYIHVSLAASMYADAIMIKFDLGYLRYLALLHGSPPTK